MYKLISIPYICWELKVESLSLPVWSLLLITIPDSCVDVGYIVDRVTAHACMSALHVVKKLMQYESLQYKVICLNSWMTLYQGIRGSYLDWGTFSHIWIKVLFLQGPLMECLLWYTILYWQVHHCLVVACFVPQSYIWPLVLFHKAMTPTVILAMWSVDV